MKPDRRRRLKRCVEVEELVKCWPDECVECHGSDLVFLEQREQRVALSFKTMYVAFTEQFRYYLLYFTCILRLPVPLPGLGSKVT